MHCRLTTIVAVNFVSVCGACAWEEVELAMWHVLGDVFFCRLTKELDRKYAPGSCTLVAGSVMVGVACVFKGAA